MANQSTINSSTSLDSLLDATLDDLADLPEFTVLPAGVHKCTIDFETKEVNKHPSIELKIKLVETLELADPASTDAPLVPGTESSVLFMMDNGFGQGKFKEVIKPLLAHFGSTKVRDAVEQAKGMEVVLVTKQRINRDTKIVYMDIVSLHVL